MKLITWREYYLLVMKKIKLNKDYFTLVDEEDFDFLSQWNWYVKDNGCGNLYVVRQDKHKKEYSMHRVLMEVSDENIHVDHKNGNGLDNRRLNLRTCSNHKNRFNCKINKRNTTGFKGVREKKGKRLKKPYQAGVVYNRKYYHLGYFKSAEEAGSAYDIKAKELFGEFARLNFPEKELK